MGFGGAAEQGQEQDLGGREALVITVSSGGPWGAWAWLEMCPKGSYASSVRFKVQPLHRCPQLVQGPLSHGEITPHFCSLAGRATLGGDGG